MKYLTIEEITTLKEGDTVNIHSSTNKSIRVIVLDVDLNKSPIDVEIKYLYYNPDWKSMADIPTERNIEIITIKKDYGPSDFKFYDFKLGLCLINKTGRL